MLIIKSVGLDLALKIRADSNLTALQKNHISRLYSPRVTLVNPKIIIGRNLIRIKHASIITAVKRAI